MTQVAATMSPERTKKAERKATLDRKDALIAATLKCLSEDGHDGLSIRRISAEAGVSVGLINHHYANKEDLVAQAYEHLTLSHLEVIKAAVAAADDTAAAQMKAFIRSMTMVVIDPGVLRCWAVFWTMTRPGNVLQEIHSQTYKDYLRVLEDIFRRLAAENGNPLLDTRLAAVGLMAMLDGTWIVLSLNPEALEIEEAIRLAEAWVDAIVKGGVRGAALESYRIGNATS